MHILIKVKLCYFPFLLKPLLCALHLAPPCPHFPSLIDDLFPINVTDGCTSMKTEPTESIFVVCVYFASPMSIDMLM